MQGLRFDRDRFNYTMRKAWRVTLNGRFLGYVMKRPEDGRWYGIEAYTYRTTGITGATRVESAIDLFKMIEKG